jgi:hypothetical protein
MKIEVACLNWWGRVIRYYVPILFTLTIIICANGYAETGLCICKGAETSGGVTATLYSDSKCTQADISFGTVTSAYCASLIGKLVSYAYLFVKVNNVCIFRKSGLEDIKSCCWYGTHAWCNPGFGFPPP